MWKSTWQTNADKNIIFLVEITHTLPLFIISREALIQQSVKNLIIQRKGLLFAHQILFKKKKEKSRKL